MKFCLAIVVAAAVGAVTGEGSSLSLRSELANVLERSLTKEDAAEALIGTIVALANKACPDQVGQCEEDNECAQEIKSLIRGAQPISAAAQALMQCVRSNMAQNRLELRSDQSVGSSVEHFGGALQKKHAHYNADDPEKL